METSALKLKDYLEKLNSLDQTLKQAILLTEQARKAATSSKSPLPYRDADKLFIGQEVVHLLSSSVYLVRIIGINPLKTDLGRAELNHDLFTDASEFPDAKRLKVIKQVSLSKDRSSLRIRLLDEFIFGNQTTWLLSKAADLYIAPKYCDYDINNAGNAISILGMNGHIPFDVIKITQLVKEIENDVMTNKFEFISIPYS